MKNLFWMVALAAIFLMTESCKEDNRIGVNLIEELIESSVEEYNDISATPITGDSLISVNQGYGYVGRYNDPIFGESKAGFIMKFFMNAAIPVDTVTYEEDGVQVTHNLPFGPNPVVDSVVLMLAYDTTYTLDNVMGNKAVEQFLSVHLQAADFAEDEKMQADPSAYIGEKIEDIRHKFQVQAPTSFRVRIDTDADNQKLDFFPEGMSELELAEVYRDNESFQETVLNGLVIKNNPEQQNENIVRFYLYGDSTLLRLYYRNDLTAADETPYYDFRTVENVPNTEHYIFVEHNYDEAEFEPILDETETPNAFKRLYVQPLGGIRTLLQFPTLLNWKADEDIFINKAQLVVKPVSELEQDDLLAIFKYADADTLQLLPEYTSIGTSGGISLQTESYDAIDDVYVFDITSFVKEMRAGNPDGCQGLIVRHVNAIGSFGSNVLHSRNAEAEENKMFLRITYSQLEK